MTMYALAAGPLLLRCWGEEAVLYNSTSGDTHLVGRMAAGLLQRIEAAPAELMTLVTEFADDATPPETDALRIALEQLLDRFEHMALIVRLPS